MSNEDLIKQIEAIDTAEDMARVADLIRAEPGRMAPEVQTALLGKLEESTARRQAARHEVINTLNLHGISYPLKEWLTPANYAIAFGIENVATVTNWISRGVIPADHVKEIPELGLRLVKAVQYNPRTYKERAKGASDPPKR
ncbi:MAG: hypothetical protein JWP57_4260 [Spirosoma sp.]|nr:hypothetical protein [Spirosoma sp.]